MKYKRTLTLITCLLLLAGCALTGTLAFPDVISDGASAKKSTVMGVDTTEPKLEIDLDILTDEGALLIPGSPFDQTVRITNVKGSTAEAYVWFTYAVPEALLTRIGNNADAPIAVTVADSEGWAVNEAVYDGKNYRRIQDSNGDYFIEGTCIYNGTLAPEEDVSVCLRSTLDVHIDVDDNGNYYWVEGDTRTPTGYKSMEGVGIAFEACAIARSDLVAAGVNDTAAEAYKLYYSKPVDTESAQ